MARRMPLPNMGLLSGAGFAEIPMELPGLVRDALEAFGLLEDPQPELRSRGGEWVALRPWEIQVDIPLEGFTDERAFLELWGLCGKGRVWIDEEELQTFSSGNLCIELTRFLRPDLENLRLTLHFDPALPKGTPPMPSVGIVGGMWLRGVSFLSIQSLQAIPHCATGQIQVTTEVEAFTSGEYTFSYALMHGEELLYKEEVAEKLGASTRTLAHTIHVRQPQWWQVGQQNQLYTLRLAVNRGPVGCDRTQQQVGFRSIDIVHSAVEGRVLISGLNGKPFMLRGAVWQSPTWQIRTEGQLRATLDAVRAAHMNCLKVHHAEGQSFYDECDQRGILVWQVLPFDVEEAKMFLRQFGHHACIVMWSLPELFVDENRPAPLLHPQVKPIADLLAGLSDGRPFLGTTPGGPIAHATLSDLDRGICFDVQGPDIYRGADWLGRYFAMDDALIRTMSQPALLPLPRLRKLAGEYAPWPPEGVLWTHRGGRPPQLDPVDSHDWLSRDITGDVEQMVRLSRYWQAQMLRYAAQRARARGATGFFAGQLNERFAVLSSPALIEFTGDRRPAFHALASAFAPVCLCARLDRLAFWVDTHVDFFVEMLVDDDTEDTNPVSLSAIAYNHAGDRIFTHVWSDLPLRTRALEMQRFRLPDFPGVVLLRLEATRGEDQVIAREDIVLCVGLRAPESPLIAPPLTLLTIEEGCLLNAGESVAFGLTCDGYEEAYMPGWGALLPGEFHPICQNAHIEGHNMQLLFAAPPVEAEEGLS